jgi:nicotinamide phosphoribosyltransferase
VDIICGRQVTGDMYDALDNDLLIKVDGGYREVYNSANYPEGYEDSLDEDKLWSEPEQKGVIELLWDIFGGTVNEQGYKVLDSHIGMIYGEAINQNNIQEIFSRLEAKGFAATNCFFGQGSYSMQMVTRDTWGMALKCVAQQKDGELVEIFKNPITDSGMKKSAKGLTVVYKDNNGDYYLKDQATIAEILNSTNELKVRFKDGKFYNQTTLTDIRERINTIL